VIWVDFVCGKRIPFCCPCQGVESFGIIAVRWNMHEFGADAAALAMFNSILNRMLVRVSLDYK
jgi:hypothetical protein